MANYHLGDRERAEEILGAARRIIPTLPNQVDPPAFRVWQNWVIAAVALREAEALLGTPALEEKR
jgi:hypothetical protein